MVVRRQARGHRRVRGEPHGAETAAGAGWRVMADERTAGSADRTTRERPQTAARPRGVALGATCGGWREKGASVYTYAGSAKRMSAMAVGVAPGKGSPGDEQGRVAQGDSGAQ